MNLDFTQFTSIAADSRNVRPGCVFFAVRGARQDGHDFVEQALANGAKAAFIEKGHPLAEKLGSLANVFAVESTKKALGEAAASFHKNPSRRIPLFGVTGTNGKTTVTFLMEGILAAAQMNPGLIGTVQNRMAGWSAASTHSTPDAVALQKLLAEFVARGARSAAMEVTSHALDQERTWGCEFRSCVFTNLTQDHLDYHRTMEGYFSAKLRLFTEYPARSRILHAADPFGEKIAAELRKRKLGYLTYGGENADLEYSSLISGANGISGTLGKLTIESPLLGEFNKQNLAAAVLCMEDFGIDGKIISEALPRIQVPGRMERVLNSQGLNVVVDYAHTPDALQKALQTLQLLAPKPSGRLCVVFGCGGDRDKTKRPLMGRIASSIADEVWITSDNPRTEDPAAIIQAILAGTASSPARIHVEPDRKKAIGAAIESLDPGSILLIAGKGHEDCQIVGADKLPFDDRLVAREYLK